MRYLLDSNLLRYLARREHGHENIIINVRRAGMDNCLLSTVVVYEIQASTLNQKLTRAERADLSRLIGFFKVLPFGKRAAAEAGKVKAALLRAGRDVGDADVMLAGHALSVGAAVASRNVKHFDRVPGLTVENWLKPG